MTITGPATRQPPAPGVTLSPPLEQGDHLTRDEFERRYAGMPQLKKAELIDGVVHMPAAVRWNQHAGPHFDLITWLGCYRAGTPGVRGGDNGTVRLDLENEPQPDAALIVEPGCGGKVKLSADDYIEGSPDLVAEVAASTASLDLNAKLRVYLRHQVGEYLVWRVFDQAIDWFILRPGRYERLAPGPDGVYRSETFPGLWLDASALVGGDLATVLRVVQQGMASPEHSAFIARLKAAPGTP